MTTQNTQPVTKDAKQNTKTLTKCFRQLLQRHQHQVAFKLSKTNKPASRHNLMLLNTESFRMWHNHLNENLRTQVSNTNNVRIFYTLCALCNIIYNNCYTSLISCTDLSPIPVGSAVKSYLASCCIQNLSKRQALQLWVTDGCFLNLESSTGSWRSVIIQVFQTFNSIYWAKWTTPIMQRC